MPLHTLSLGAWELRTWTLVGHVPFLVLLIGLYLAGRRRGWPWRSALLATTALAGGMSLGAALLPSVLGAAAGGIGLWLLAQRLLGLRRAPYASLALGLVGVVAVGRWGCLLNGCCFGRPTQLPWGIEYGAGSATWLLHRALGLIAPHAPAALPVHPYPLYESLGLLLWLGVALRLRRRLRSEVALLLFSAAYDLALRTFVGAVVLPGADVSERHWMLGASVEIFATRRLVLGLQGGSGDGYFGVGYVRAAVGK